MRALFWLDRIGRSLRGLLPTRLLAPRRAVKAYWRAYHLARLRQQAMDTPLDAVEFVVIDTETTGLDHRRDRVISFGAVRVRGREIHLREAVDWRVRAPKPSPPESIEIHGLLNQSLEGGMDEATFVERLVGFVGQAVIVGYRPGFDLAVLNRVVREQTGGRLTNPTLDVFTLGMRVDYPIKPPFVNPEPYRFDALVARFHIETPGRHTAIGDAYTTGILFVKLLERLRVQGVGTLGALLRRYG